MAAVDIRDNLLGISWVDSAWIPILNSGSVLDYFSERSNPFYDRTCNNEVVKMQRLTLEHLNQMVGVEYILLHAQEPILFIIRKQQRQSSTQDKVKPKAKRKEEPSSIFQRQRVDALLLDLRQKFPPRFVQQKSGEKPVPADQTKKEAESIPEAVRSEEKETTKNIQQTVSTKAPPEKRMRLQ
ncbi:PREDICTED: mediator of RNA polymerase II transcription subunit 6-like [Chrysochloris asiatica]|uniref:Mediator of RNA polymerase II transcription subunit 6 n=1 Tax=Chrysochloris asiatica TaxID=185453 RepID=A0A9B0TJV2_CHRAS|nr:PREDICTED: mediator of RNA polymerase II transcription subunit 6-like [Chrysochloris asiatica]